MGLSEREKIREGEKRVRFEFKGKRPQKMSAIVKNNQIILET